MQKTYYTYIITALDSDCYYYGVSHVKTANATIAQCTVDKYYGSGGTSEHNKFNTWKRQHRDTLQKEVLKTFDTREAAFAHEKALVQDFWKTDDKCLNSLPGGVYNSGIIVPPQITMKHCDQHGEVKHIGTTCYLCRQSKYVQQYCQQHGWTAHDQDVCAKCRASQAVTVQRCEKHGDTTHMYDVCTLCRNTKSLLYAYCEKHGETKHRGSYCSTCVSQSTAHKQFHQEKTQSKCWVCQEEVASGVRDPAPEHKVLQKVCALCEQIFTPKHNRQLFCSNPHDWQCYHCGTDIQPTPRRGKTLYACTGFICRRAVGAALQKL